MQVTEDTLRKVAAVARLKLSDEEIRSFVPEVQDIIDAFSKLDGLSIADTPSSFQPVPLAPTIREDVPKESLSQEEALANTAHKKEGYFMGPKVVS